MSVVPGVPLKKKSRSPELSEEKSSNRICQAAANQEILPIEDLIQSAAKPLHALPPIVPALCPFRVKLEPGKVYRYCACGRSANQPWCDFSHRPDDPQPIEFTVDDSKRGFSLICGCKYSDSQPFCDGSHIHPHKGTEEN